MLSHKAVHLIQGINEQNQGRDGERMRVAEAGETVLVGLPPFNAEHPQTIFDNILNRNIPWPAVPEEMSPEAQDLIDRLLTEDPNQRLGARGALEVKEHVFFKDINWDTLARQKDTMKIKLIIIVVLAKIECYLEFTYWLTNDFY
ncbi:probable serine/threonine protein kinase IREH1 [Arachis stenosperma]|uniref:probable serine/threonine protein kinase IREH1 n=1 Tax=Arachis stenosperma TaxID=217475 RepID=UPI0025AC4D50|nr:probable serine/threonine protein kinase IREH1 [Arachis stenosperma]